MLKNTGKKKIKILMTSLILLLIAVGGGIYYFIGTPLYSLYLLQKAVKEGNREMFYHHFDVAKVVENTVNRTTVDLPVPLQALSREATRTLVPVVEPIIKDRIEQQLQVTEKSPLTKMSLESIRVEGDQAFVVIRNQTDGTTNTLVLERMSDRQWKVIDIDLAKANIGFSVTDITKQAEKLLKTRGKRLQIPELRQLKKIFD